MVVSVHALRRIVATVAGARRVCGFAHVPGAPPELVAWSTLHRPRRPLTRRGGEAARALLARTEQTREVRTVGVEDGLGEFVIGPRAGRSPDVQDRGAARRVVGRAAWSCWRVDVGGSEGCCL
jgi:hypothetical protein